jgi:hypothetical protein
MAKKSSSVTRAEAATQLKDSASSGKLVAVVGTGVSIALTNGKFRALSWKGLVEDGFAYGVKKAKITTEQSDGWKSQLNSNDLDELLSAAEFMGRKLAAPNGDLYAHWLKSVFEHVEPEKNEMQRAVRALHAAGIPLCTLNYDTLLERARARLQDMSVNELVQVQGSPERLAILKALRSELETVLSNVNRVTNLDRSKRTTKHARSG